ncbi:MAG: S-layer homology domain-containing protein, partial [Oscillospiraceae bacterium]|nr:S-layer homology domain-containing protein [Oscillospiraceae bacterium]
FTTAFTEGLVQNALRTAVQTDSYMYTNSAVSTFLVWMDYENGNTITGIGEGAEMMSADKDYFYRFCIKTEEGYALEDEVTLIINGEEVTVFSIEHYDWGAYLNTAAPKVTVAEGFVDIPEDAWYAAPVQWAVANAITDGMDETHFCPETDCTRAQIVTFLWRAAGQPAPTATETPFVDVPEDAWFYNAVLWAVENGITDGMDETHFCPDVICTRAQAVTFLWRAVGQPAPTATETPFVDVPEDTWFYTAVLWAVENALTDGMDETHFMPENNCTRAQIVTLLWRYYV